MSSVSILTRGKDGWAVGQVLQRGAAEAILEAPEDELASIREYLEAHDLLPKARAITEHRVRRLLRVLEDESATREEIVLALVTLAHVGSRTALQALANYCRAPRRGLALMAALALDECELWARCEVSAPLVAPTKQRGRRGRVLKNAGRKGLGDP